MAKNVLIISPGFPPAINGLGDYSMILAEQLCEQNSELNIFFAGLKQIEKVDLINYEEINDINSLIKIAQSKAIDVLILNYSNYGYQKKGVPFWLLFALKILKRNNVAVITFFHEVYASGKIWQLVFWLKPLQKFIFHQLYKYSSHAFCSNNKVLGIIKNETHNQGLNARNIGMFSNIPEAQNLISWECRVNYAVVFGSLGRRKAVYAHLSRLKTLMKDLNITGIIDIGPGDIGGVTIGNGIKFSVKGSLDASTIAQILSECKWGLIDYHDSLLGKSGIFAAYAAHGMYIINFNTDQENANDGLVKGKHYVMAHEKAHLEGFSISGNCFWWYNQHNKFLHAQHILSAINQQKIA